MEYKIQNPIIPTDLCHIETVSPKAADDDTNYADNFTGFEEPNRNEARSILIAAPGEAAFDPDATMQEIPKAPKELTVEEQLPSIDTAVERLSKISTIIDTKQEASREIYLLVDVLGSSDRFKRTNLLLLINQLQNCHRILKNSTQTEADLASFYNQLDSITWQYSYPSYPGGPIIGSKRSLIEGLRMIQDTIPSAKNLVDLFEANKDKTLTEVLSLV